MIRAVIFDCFGVLVGKGFEHTYRLGGGDPVKDRDFIEEMLGRANFGQVTDDDFRDTMAQKLGITREAWREVVQKAELPDLELLAYIKGLRGKYKTAILSNANTGVLGRKIGQELLESCFDEVIVSADINMAKPDPRIYGLTAERLGVQPDECVFVDDNEGHLEPARELGMKTVLFRDSEQAKTELEKLLADPES
ncbi:MAG TPA: HAD family phosphatase [Candidatus Saccharimonadia bacterium]|nr:HAD family phosphatase [Candidatus Saccharimonadia bacterium]